jgi:hypothetical protein
VAFDELAARRVLGVSATAGPDEIRHAYRARAREHHPDRHATASLEERVRHAAAFAEANAAWLLLRGGERPPGSRGPAPGEDLEPDEPLDDLGDLDDLDEAAFDGARPGCIAITVPIALFAFAVVVFAAAVLFEARLLWQLALAAGAGAAITFALAPFFTMLRSRR